jgi:hypothetical protein
MSVIQKEISVGANAVVDNILSGSSFEFLRSNAIVSIGMAGSATGLVANIQSGADIVLEESPILVKTTMPTIPDDMYYNDAGVQGDRLVVRVRNTTGGALTVRAIVQFTPVR